MCTGVARPESAAGSSPDAVTSKAGCAAFGKLPQVACQHASAPPPLRKHAGLRRLAPACQHAQANAFARQHASASPRFQLVVSIRTGKLGIGLPCAPVLRVRLGEAATGLADSEP